MQVIIINLQCFLFKGLQWKRTGVRVRDLRIVVKCVNAFNVVSCLCIACHVIIAFAGAVRILECLLLPVCWSIQFGWISQTLLFVNSWTFRCYVLFNVLEHCCVILMCIISLRLCHSFAPGRACVDLFFFTFWLPGWYFSLHCWFACL